MVFCLIQLFYLIHLSFVSSLPSNPVATCAFGSSSIKPSSNSLEWTTMKVPSTNCPHYLCRFSKRLSSSSCKVSLSNNSECCNSDSNQDSSNENNCLRLPLHPNVPIRSVMAPMVAASDYPFRYFLQNHHGVDMTYTQMLHSKNFARAQPFRTCHLDLWETGKRYPNLLESQQSCLEGLPTPPQFLSQQQQQKQQSMDTTNSISPLMVQLAGHDVHLITKVASMILDHTMNTSDDDATTPLSRQVSGFDLNLGCPQGIARKGYYGAFLMEQDLDLVCNILKQLRQTVPTSTAISAKIRLPADDDLLRDRIPRLIETGINFLTIHGRTFHENKTKVGQCHIERIAFAVNIAHSVDRDFPIVANGGIEHFEDVENVIQATGAVAAMSSEALLETPNLFVQSSKNLTPRQLLNQQLSFARDYLDVCATVGPPLPFHMGQSKGGSCSIMKGHLLKFLHRYLQENLDLLDKLVVGGIVQTIVQARALVDELEHRYDRLSDSELEACYSSSPDASWYRRHRSPDRRVRQKEVAIRSTFVSNKHEEKSNTEELKDKIRLRLAKLKEEKKGKATKVF